MSELEQRIEEELAAARQRTAAQRSEMARGYEGLATRYDGFVEMCGRILEDPRVGQLKKLAAAFEHAHLKRLHDRGGYHGTVEFRYTPRFPASVTVSVHMRPDAQFRTVTFSFDVQMTPAFIKYRPHDEISFPLDDVDLDAAFAWADNKIVEFVRTYTELETAEEYQRENLVTDPVLGLRFSRIHAAAQEEYKGNVLFFLTEESQAVFHRDPEAFVAA